MCLFGAKGWWASRKEPLQQIGLGLPVLSQVSCKQAFASSYIPKIIGHERTESSLFQQQKGQVGGIISVKNGR